MLALLNHCNVRNITHVGIVHLLLNFWQIMIGKFLLDVTDFASSDLMFLKLIFFIFISELSEMEKYIYYTLRQQRIKKDFALRLLIIIVRKKLSSICVSVCVALIQDLLCFRKLKAIFCWLSFLSFLPAESNQKHENLYKLLFLIATRGQEVILNTGRFMKCQNGVSGGWHIFLWT